MFTREGVATGFELFDMKSMIDPGGGGGGARMSLLAVITINIVILIILIIIGLGACRRGGSALVEGHPNALAIQRCGEIDERVGGHDVLPRINTGLIFEQSDGETARLMVLHQQRHIVPFFLT